MDIRERIKLETKGYSMYNIRRDEYKSANPDCINFRISPEPFKLDKDKKKKIEEIGKAICDYMDACIEIYKNDENAHNILDRGKPENLKNVQEVKYLFLRPDLIITDTGFCLCEIETSPFGLGLAEVLNRAYGHQGFDTLVYQNDLKNYIQSNIKMPGVIAYSNKVKAFKGQLEFMANDIFSQENKIWTAREIGKESIKEKEIYRAFYLSEELKDSNLEEILREKTLLPTSTPQFEEKALLSFIWDKRYSEILKNRLGNVEFNLLRNVIPKTWIIGEEKYVEGGLPYGKQNSLEIAELGKSERKFVLKRSGYGEYSSWGEGVKFLHKMGKHTAEEFIKSAISDNEHLYIMQEFKKGRNFSMPFINDDGIFQEMKARIRITPYYAYTGENKGKLIAAKVTGCENTEYIHASTASINTAVSYEKER